MTAGFNEDYDWQFFAVKSGSPLSGVKVYAYDQAETQVVNQTTGAGGDIPVQQLRDTAYSVTGTVETPTANTPHRVIAGKYGDKIFVQDIPITAESSNTNFYESDSSISEATEATVLAYTGIVFNDGSELITLDNSGGTPVDNVDKLYDRCRARALNTPLYDPARGVIDESPDKVNYNPVAYDLTVDGFSFAGQSRNLVFASGKGLTVQGAGGIVNDIAITGDYNLDTDANLQNVTITGDLRINTGANSTLSFTNVNVSGNVWNDAAANTLTINATGSSLTAGDPGTGVGQTNILTSVPVKVTVLDKDTGSPLADARVRLVLASDKSVVLSGDCDVNGEISGAFGGTTPANVIGWAREMNLSATDYEQEDIAGTITTSGFDQVVSLRPISVQ